MFHTIKKVTPLPNYRLLVLFTNGISKTYDISALFDTFPIFRMSEELFNQVHVAVGGHGIIWNEDIDLFCEDLWEDGKLVE